MSSLVLVSAPPPSPSLSTLSSGLSFSQSETFGRYSFFFTSSASWSLSATISLSPVPLVICGRGDRKTAKGKRFNHSFGNARPRDKKKGRGPPRIPLPPSAPKEEKFEVEVEDQNVEIENDDE